MTHRKDKPEEHAIALLERIVAISVADRDALPGSAVKCIKAALTILKKRRKRQDKTAGQKRQVKTAR